MKVYTKTGDDGKTSLYNTKLRVKKSDPVFDVLGSLDELNAQLGFLHRTKLKEVRDLVYSIQKDLFMLGAYVAGKKLGVEDKVYWKSRLEHLESDIDFFDTKNTLLTNFILPGGCVESCHLHASRVLARNLERSFVKYKEKTRLKNCDFIQVYLNRVSDLFFVMARYANKKLQIKDIIWKTSEK